MAAVFGISAHRWAWALAIGIAVVMNLANPTICFAAKKATKTLLKQAKKHYKAGQYADAAAKYHALYARSGKAIDLFNAARSEQRAFQLDAAQRDYERYLKTKRPPKRGVKRARVHLLEIAEARRALQRARSAEAVAQKLVASASAPQRKEQASVAATPTGQPSKLHGPLVLGAAGIGLVGAGLGTLWVLGANRDSDELDSKIDADGGPAISFADASAESDRINSQYLQGYIAFAVGGAALGTAAWLWLGRRDATHALLVPGPVLRGVGVQMSF